MAPKRKYSAYRTDPIDDDGPPKPCLRWSEKARVMMVSAVVMHLSNEQLLNLMAGGEWPGSQTEQKALPWASITARIEHYIDAEDAKHGGEPTLDPAKDRELTERNIREAAKTWTERFLRRAHVHDDAPHKPGYLAERNDAHLQKVYDMICAGYTDAKGQQCIFHSLQHLEHRRPEAKQLRTAPHPHGCGLTTTLAMWRQLQQRFPELDRVAINARRDRDPVPVQVCVAAGGPLRCVRDRMRSVPHSGATHAGVRQAAARAGGGEGPQVLLRQERALQARSRLPSGAPPPAHHVEP